MLDDIIDEAIAAVVDAQRAIADRNAPHGSEVIAQTCEQIPLILRGEAAAQSNRCQMEVTTIGPGGVGLLLY